MKTSSTLSQVPREDAGLKGASLALGALQGTRRSEPVHCSADTHGGAGRAVAEAV